MPQSFVDFEGFRPGDAVLHLGGQYHAALPITEGERINMVVWLHGKHEASEATTTAARPSQASSRAAFVRPLTTCAGGALRAA